MIRVLVVEGPENVGRNLDVEAAILGKDVGLERCAWDGNESDLVASCRDADVILSDFVPFTATSLRQLDRCRLISLAATGYGNVDLRAAEEAGIRVCAIDEYCTDEVADHTLALLLALSRRLVEYHAQVQHELRWQFDSLSGLRSLRELTLGIVGFGRIGQAVARRARGFGMDVIVHDPYENPVAAELGARYCTLPALFAEADVISLHCNLGADNCHLIDADAIAGMRRKPILINCARGDLVDEHALIAALDSGQIAAAGLDVLQDESPDLPSSGLTGRPNVILTPHAAFYSDRALLASREISAQNIRYFLDGEHDKVRKYIRP